MSVPFKKKDELFPISATSSAALSLPSTSSQSDNTRLRRLFLPVIRQEQGKQHSLQLIDPAKSEDLQRYLSGDLDVNGPNKIHKHLWFAGLPKVVVERLRWQVIGSDKARRVKGYYCIYKDCHLSPASLDIQAMRLKRK